MPCRAEEPAADLLDPAQRPRVVADVDPHLGPLVHQRDRARDVTLVEAFEEHLHRVALLPWPECSVRGCRGLEAAAGAPAAAAGAAAAEPAAATPSPTSRRVPDRAQGRHHPAEVGDRRRAR